MNREQSVGPPDLRNAWGGTGNPDLTVGANSWRPSGPLVMSRRDLLGQMATGVGATALATLLARDSGAAETASLHFPPKAKRIIFLFQSGAPSQLDLFDYKPKLENLRATELPDSIRQG